MESNKQQAEHPAFVAFLCHLAFWFGPLFAVPLFVALHNRDDVVFSSAWLAGWTALACLLISVVGWKTAEWAGTRFQWWLNRILVSLALLIAVQSNVIHDLFYYGAFNGQEMDLRAYGISFWLEWSGYLLAFPVVLILLSRLSRLPAWLPALPILSFTFLLIPALLSAQPVASSANSYGEVDPSVFAFSSQSNLIHLLPDGFQGDVVREVLQQNPDLAAKFEGFTLFTDHLGLYQGTAPALFTIMTGAPFDLERGFSYDWVKPELQSGAYQNQLFRQGYQIDYVPISPLICIKGANSCESRPFNTMQARGYFRHHNEDSLYSARLIADLALFRLVPMFLKEKIYDKGNWFLSDTTLGGFSPWPDPVIREWVENFRVIDNKSVYKWYHYIGTHMPARWDKHCRMRRNLEHERENYKAQAYCILNGVGELLDRLKQADIYDQTAMVISGDHGHNIFPDDMSSQPVNAGLYLGLLGSGRPALLVKQKHQRQPLQFSSAPTSLLDVAPTALDLVGIETAAQTVFDLEESQSRVREFTPYFIPDFYSGRPVPYNRYRVNGPTHAGNQWVLTDIRSFREPPAAYEPVNHRNAAGFMVGASLNPNEPDKGSAWIRGRQVSFLINLPNPQSAHSMQVTLHLPDWVPEQSLRVQLNNAPAGKPVMLRPGDEYWQDLALQLEPDQLHSGRNFVSILFDHTYPSPKISTFRASALLKSIRISSESPSARPGADFAIR